MNKYKLPNFLFVGGCRCGSTSIYFYLKQHPEVFLPEKDEINFFRSETIDKQSPDGFGYPSGYTSRYEDYVNLYRNVSEKAVGDTTPTYLYDYKVAIPKIKQYLGDVKIIMILRNPVERAISHYRLHYNDFLDLYGKPVTIESLWNENEKQMVKMTIYGFGFYYEPVKAYLNSFKDVKVYLFDDFKKDTAKIYKDICDFIGVDSSFVPPDINVKHHNSTYVKRKYIRAIAANKYLINTWDAVKSYLPYGLRSKVKAISTFKVKIEDDTCEFMKSIYREDLIKLESLINVNLQHWM